ncbi:MAG: ABC transporter substrate-binding protein [Erysipelotrichaceae bacterium]|nr:ABC transporter substrate-binding protein [Erysipelotrichaceae bacterium]
MKLRKVLVCLLMAAMLTACGSSGGSAKSDFDMNSVKLGFDGPLSGAVSQYGVAVRNGVNLALKQYNEAHGTNIEVVAYDDKGDATTAVNNYNKLVDDDGITALVGPVTSGPTLAVVAAATKNNTPILTPSGSADAITMNGDSAYENVFRVCCNDSFASTYLAQQCPGLGFKKVGILYNKELDYSQGLDTAFIAEAKNQNVEVVYNEAYNTNTKDFATFITALKKLDMDALYIPDYYETADTIVKQLRDAGIKCPVMGADGWDGVLEVKGVNKKDLEGCLFVTGFDKDAEGQVATFMKSFKDEYNTDGNFFSALGYDALNIMLQAIEEAGSLDPAEINKALANIKVTDAVCGGYTYDENHNPIKEMIIVNIKDGKYTTK